MRDLGGELKTGEHVTSLAQLPDARALFFDLGPMAAVELLGQRAAPRVARSARRFRYGAGVCKVDYALSEPVPWTALDARRAGTLHLGGSMAEIATAELDVSRGQAAKRPFVLVSQPTVCDSTRAPEGVHTLWAYCHVPAASALDASEAIDAQIERFAPGFRDVVIARSVRTTRDLEASNPNLVGGDIAGGALDHLQLLARPGSPCSRIGSAMARTSARPRHRPVPACTACVATTRRTPRSAASCVEKIFDERLTAAARSN